MIGVSNAPTSNITQCGQVKKISRVNGNYKDFAIIDDIDLSRYNYVFMEWHPGSLGEYYERDTEDFYIWILNTKTNKIEYYVRNGRLDSRINEGLLFSQGAPYTNYKGDIYVRIENNKLIFYGYPADNFYERLPSKIQFV